VVEEKSSERKLRARGCLVCCSAAKVTTKQNSAPRPVRSRLPSGQNEWGRPSGRKLLLVLCGELLEENHPFVSAVQLGKSGYADCYLYVCRCFLFSKCRARERRLHVFHNFVPHPIAHFGQRGVSRRFSRVLRGVNGGCACLTCEHFDRGPRRWVCGRLDRDGEYVDDIGMLGGELQTQRISSTSAASTYASCGRSSPGLPSPP
jgi:hypothetical protein